MLEPTTNPDELNPPEGQLLLVNKPLGWTSFDVVNKLRYHIKRTYKLKKIKVGHAGTLDPLATGLLLICTGKKTKELHLLTGQEKTYTGSFILGKSTPSFDLETKVDQEYPTSHISEQNIQEAATSMVGWQDQIPPLFSAKKVDGKRAYKTARQGGEMELKPHHIEILDFRIIAIEMPRVDFLIRCSKGTYIRSIARDFGHKLESGAYLSALKRTASGSYTLSQAFEIEEIIEAMQDNMSGL